MTEDRTVMLTGRCLRLIAVALLVLLGGCGGIDPNAMSSQPRARQPNFGSRPATKSALRSSARTDFLASTKLTIPGHCRFRWRGPSRPVVSPSPNWSRNSQHN